MIKNTSGQKVGVQMVSATDGSAFTGSVTVAVTVDAGTQATGSVGSGACTHEGNGYHTYAPSQAETNGDLVAFTFTGTGAVPQTVQVYTRASAPDVNVSTIANNAITAAAIATDAIGAAELAADAVTEIQSGLATASALSTVAGYVDTEVAAIKAKTDNLPSDPADASDVAAAFSTVNSTLSTIAGYIDTEVAAIKAKTDNLPSDPADQSAVEAAITAAIGTGGAALTAIPWNAAWDAEVQSEVADALEATIADSIPADGTAPSVKQALYMLTQFMLERSVSSTTVTVKKPDGSTSLFTLTLDSGTAPTSITRAT